MNNKLLGIVHTALDNFFRQTEIKGEWKQTVQKETDGEIGFLINDRHQHCYVTVRKEIRNHQLPQLQSLALRYKNHFMIVAERIFPNIKEALRQNNIPYLEANGNVWFKKGKLFLWIDTHKEVMIEKEKINRAFTKTGLKVIFHFLLNDTHVNQTYREIAQITDVGLGNINYVINGLKENGYLINLNVNQYKLINKEELLERWMIAYEERLKPALFAGTFKFVKHEDFDQWKQIKFKDINTQWGGEPAGDILTNYIKPGALTIYTIETRADLMKHYHLIPDPLGNIKVYHKFWSTSDAGKIVPPLLIYVDLMNTGDPRNMEVAKKIYKNALQDKF
jgi:hypothetical protein